MIRSLWLHHRNHNIIILSSSLCNYRSTICLFIISLSPSSLAPLQVIIPGLWPQLLNILVPPNVLQQAPAVLLRGQNVLVIRIHRVGVHAQHQALAQASSHAELQRKGIDILVFYFKYNYCNSRSFKCLL